MAEAKQTKRVRKAPAIKTEAVATPKVKAIKPPPAPKVVKPSIPTYGFASAWDGASDATNTRVSRTKIDHTRFGTLKDAPMTDRDIKALDALRGQFGNKAFPRANVDAGILRRLGERGYVQHVQGSEVDPMATFKLTARKAA